MKKCYQAAFAAAVGTSMLLVGSGSATAGTGPGTTDDLEGVVKRQQQQLDAQASEIAGLKEKLNALLGTTEKNKEALAAKVDKEELDKLKVDKMVSSKKANVDVELYGQVNRAGLWADNGDSSKVYFVDNDGSSTRMGIKARAKATDDLSIGGRIEYELITNPSHLVNQEDQSVSGELNLRWADVDFKSKSLGTLYLGQGSAFSDGTTEVDLSGTKVITYSKARIIGGGQLWYDSSTNTLTDEMVRRTFDNLDGLSRKDRLRYDSPSFAGFKIGGSAIESGAFDAGLKYSRQFDGAKVAGQVTWWNPNDLDTGVDDAWGGSLSVLLDMGLSFTLAGAKENSKDDGRDDPNFYYGKIGYKANLISPGVTAFSVGYGIWNDFRVNNDEGKTFDLGFVQNVKDWGTEFYLGYRLFQLDRDNTDYDNVNAVMAGARLKF